MKKGRKKMEEVPMLQTHGRIEEQNNGETKQVLAAEKPKYQKLSQILRAQDEDYRDYGFYNTDDAAKYEEYIKGLSRANLEQHCRAVGFIPTGETHLILKQLIKSFKQHFQSNMKLPQPKTFSKQTENKIKSLLSGKNSGSDDFETD